MDDFVQILIYIIIIVSFLSSLFKKKGKETPVPAPRQKPDSNRNENYQAAGKTNEDETEIFREIADLFKTDVPQKSEPARRQTAIEQKTTEHIPTSTEHSSEEYKKTESEHVSYETERSSIEHTPTSSEHAIDPSWHKPEDWSRKKKRRVDLSVEKQAEKFKELLERRGSDENVYKSKIKEMLKNPQSLKEYILISEIIGRPKALRR